MEIRPDMAPQLIPVSWLLGTWRGVGVGGYPTVPEFRFAQEVTFTELPGKPFVHHLSRSWLLDDEGAEVRPLAQETGYWRPEADGSLEVLPGAPDGLRRDLGRLGRRREDRAADRRRRAHRDGQGLHRRAPALRPGRGRPAVGLRHGGHGPAAAAAPVRHPEAGMSSAPSIPTGKPRTPTCTPPSRPRATGSPRSGSWCSTPSPGCEHGTPDEICAEVQRTAPGVNLSTVYRTLELLEELALVTHAHLGHGAPTYHAAGGDHLHLVCRDCGAVTETDVELADALVATARRAARLRDRRRPLRDLRPVPGVLIVTSPLLERARRRRGRPAGRRCRRALRRPVPRAARAGRRRGVGRPVAPPGGAGRRPGPADLAALADLPAPRAPRAGRADRGAGAVAARPRRARALPRRRRRGDLGARRAGDRRGAGRLPGPDAVLVEGRGRGPLLGVRRGARRPTGVPGAPSRVTAHGVESFVPRADLATVLAGPLAGVWALEALRIADGRPRLGLETDHRTIPHEVGLLETAVHLDKGCYRGQETVARVHNLGPAAAPAGAAAPRRQRLGAARARAPGAARRPRGRPGDVSARHYELGPIALAVVKRLDAGRRSRWCAGGVAAAKRSSSRLSPFHVTNVCRCQDAHERVRARVRPRGAGSPGRR